MKQVFWMIVVLNILSVTWCAGQDDVADIRSEKRTIGPDKRQTYFYIQPTAKTAPAKGFGVLVILPGGNGSEDFHTFVKRIRKHAVPKDLIVVQPVAIKWTDEQVVVWPTEGLKVDRQKISTEQFVTNVIKDIKKDLNVDASRIYCMGWSSSGPAVYSLALMKDTMITGSYVVMSVFKPKQLPPLSNAKGRSIYIEHSEQDKICPYQMAREGFDQLKKNGAKTKLIDYVGGHGWRGNVYGRISAALDWLENGEPIFAKGKNLVSNSNLAQGDVRPKDWDEGQPVPGVKYSWKKSSKMKEKSYLSITKTANRYFPIASWSQQINYDGEAKVIFLSADVKALEARKAVLDIIFKDENGQTVSHKWAAYIGSKNSGDQPATHDWKQYSGTANIPPKTRKIVVSLQCYGPGSVSFTNIAASFSEN